MSASCSAHLCKNKEVTWPKFFQILGPTQLSSEPVWLIVALFHKFLFELCCLNLILFRLPARCYQGSVWPITQALPQTSGKKKKTKFPLCSDDRKLELLQTESPCPFPYTSKASSVSLLSGKTKRFEHHPLIESTLRRPSSPNFAECTHTLLLDANDGFTTLLSLFC